MKRKSEETEENIKVSCIAKENGWFQNFWTRPLEAKFSLNYTSLLLWYSANKTTWQSLDPSCCLKCPKKRNMTLYLIVSFQWVYFKVLKIGDNMIRIPNSLDIIFYLLPAFIFSHKMSFCHLLKWLLIFSWKTHLKYEISCL